MVRQSVRALTGMMLRLLAARPTKVLNRGPLSSLPTLVFSDLHHMLSHRLLSTKCAMHLHTDMQGRSASSCVLCMHGELHPCMRPESLCLWASARMDMCT